MGWIIGLLAFFGFLSFLIHFPRQILTGIGIIIAVIALLYYACFYLPDQNRKILQEKVVVTVLWDTTKCGVEYPLFISVNNNSNKIMSKVTWAVEAYKPGYSTNLAGYNNDYCCDKILKPGEIWTLCYRVPSSLKAEAKPISTLEYRIAYKNVYFQDQD